MLIYHRELMFMHWLMKEEGVHEQSVFMPLGLLYLTRQLALYDLHNQIDEDFDLQDEMPYLWDDDELMSTHWNESIDTKAMHYAIDSMSGMYHEIMDSFSCSPDHIDEMKEFMWSTQFNTMNKMVSLSTALHRVDKYLWYRAFATLGRPCAYATWEVLEQFWEGLGGQVHLTPCNWATDKSLRLKEGDQIWIFRHGMPMYMGNATAEMAEWKEILPMGHRAPLALTDVEHWTEHDYYVSMACRSTSISLSNLWTMIPEEGNRWQRFRYVGENDVRNGKSLAYC